MIDAMALLHCNMGLVAATAKLGPLFFAVHHENTTKFRSRFRYFENPAITEF
ncbi:MAG TPA: hypothetical protein VIL69_06655 [Roseomonas sp.]|jgi:hypothetical protein